MLVVSKSSLLLGIIATSALLLGVLIGRPLTDVRQGQRVPVVTITPGSFKYRLAGEFDRDGLPVNAPLTRVRIGSPFKIMRTQVSAADYQRCVVARACPALGAAEPGGADIPATGVSWHDATAFAAWMSKMTGQRWRLPSDVEWALAAGSRFKDDAVRGDDAQDFAQRWIAKYEQDAAEAKPTTKAERVA